MRTAGRICQRFYKSQSSAIDPITSHKTFTERSPLIKSKTRHLSISAASPLNSPSYRGLSTTTEERSEQEGTQREFIPRRAVFYVPGSDEKKINKIPSLNADCIVLDCEDGVAANKKVSFLSKYKSRAQNSSIRHGSLLINMISNISMISCV